MDASKIARHEQKITYCEQKITYYEQKIVQIEAGQGLAEGTTIAEKRALVKSQEDQILALRAEIHDIHQQQLQLQISSSSAGRCFTFR